MRAIILAEGKLGIFTSKTATCFIMYRKDNVLAVVDSTKAGTIVEEHLGLGGNLPVIGTIEDALHLKPDTLIIDF